MARSVPPTHLARVPPSSCVRFQAPDKFLADLVSVTMSLESQLPGSTALGRHWSPHREALVPYLRRHATEAVAYFLERLGAAEPTKEAREASARAFRMLASLVRHKEAVEVTTTTPKQVPTLRNRDSRIVSQAQGSSRGEDTATKTNHRP